MQARDDQYLTFFLAGEEYAITILQVTEIIECGARDHACPGTPPWIRGVHNLRGAVVPVIDLAVKFGLPPDGDHAPHVHRHRRDLRADDERWSWA